MEDVPLSTTRRVLRALLAGGILATAWVAIDLIAHSDSASAVEIEELVPAGSAAPVVDGILAETAPWAPTAAEVVAEAIAPVAESLEPAVAEVVEPALPVVEAVAPPLQPVVEAVVPVIQQLPALPVAGAVLASGGLALGGALVVSLTPLLPVAPAGGGQKTPPHSPSSPPGSGVSPIGFIGELGTGILAGLSATLSALAAGMRLPASPTYSFDTTPD